MFLAELSVSIICLKTKGHYKKKKGVGRQKQKENCMCTEVSKQSTVKNG